MATAVVSSATRNGVRNAPAQLGRRARKHADVVGERERDLPEKSGGVAVRACCSIRLEITSQASGAVANEDSPSRRSRWIGRRGDEAAAETSLHSRLLQVRPQQPDVAERQREAHPRR